MNWLIVLLTISVAAIKFGQGLENEKKYETNSPSLNSWLVIKAVFTVIFLAPILFMLSILIFKPALPITCALIIMACSPAANLSNQRMSKLGGDVLIAGRIDLIVSLISIVSTPMLLTLIELLMGLNIELKTYILIEQLAITQFFPTILGVFIRKRHPKFSYYAKFIIRAASSLLIIIFMLLMIQHYQSFGQLRLQGYAAVILATISAFLLGVIIAGKNTKQQISIAIETGLRNPGLAYLIASENFIEEYANIIMVPYTATIIVTIISCIYTLKLSQKLFRDQ